MSGRLLAVDWGDKRIGLAISDELGMMASPAGTITRRAGKRPPLAELIRQAEALNASEYIFGLPLDANGSETARCREIRGVVTTLSIRQLLRVRLVDERFTTSAALRSIREQGGSTRGRKDDVDAMAACVLLEGVLRAEKQGVTLGEVVRAVGVDVVVNSGAASVERASRKDHAGQPDSNGVTGTAESPGTATKQ